MAGTRCLLGEVHALVSTGFLGSAKRRASGLDSSRLAMLIAVLEKHGGLRLADQDVFAQALGGLKIAEPAADLSIALAVAGAFLHRTLPHGTVAIGEVGLTGELRTVPHLEQRVHESLRRGARVVLVPSSAKIGANVERDARNEQRDIVKVGTIQRALDVLTPVQRALTEGRSTSDALGATERGTRTPPAELAEPKAGVKRRG
jgi:predicted ATP-dependent serine protease